MRWSYEYVHGLQTSWVLPQSAVATYRLCVQTTDQADLDHWPYAIQLLGHIYNGNLYELFAACDRTARFCLGTWLTDTC